MTGDLPAEVRTDRLRLPLITADLAADMRAGRRHAQWHPDFPREDDLDGASMVRPGSTWGPRLILRVEPSPGLVCGSIGFFGPPSPAEDGVAETEVGYGLVAEARGHGLATEALRGLLGATDRLGVRVRAGVAPDNTASIRVLTKAGFTRVRGTTASGELVLVRPPRLPDPDATPDRP